MIKQTIYVGKYDWDVYAFYDVDFDDIDIILTKLNDIECNYITRKEIYKLLKLDTPDNGVTYSNYSNRSSVMIIGYTDYADEFLNTLVHELRHLNDHISKYYNLHTSSEEVAVMIGNIAKAAYHACYTLL